jgi:hypothetical protein
LTPGGSICHVHSTYTVCGYCLPKQSVILVCTEDFVRKHSALNHFISHFRHYLLANDNRAGKFANPDNPRRDNREYSFILEFHIGLRIISLAISNNKLGLKKKTEICNSQDLEPHRPSFKIQKQNCK